jgi:hypothetical protein
VDAGDLARVLLLQSMFEELSLLDELSSRAQRGICIPADAIPNGRGRKDLCAPPYLSEGYGFSRAVMTAIVSGFSRCGILFQPV